MLASQVFRKWLVLTTPSLAQMPKDAPFAEMDCKVGFEEMGCVLNFQNKYEIHFKSVFLLHKTIFEQKSTYMKSNTFLTLLISVLCLTVVSAQDSQTVKQLNFGFVGASFEIPVHKDISIAPYAGTDLNLDWLALGAKGNYYFDNLFELPSAWDVYAGLNAGFAIGLGSNGNSDINFGLHVGGRWFWNDKWGINVELGGGSVTDVTGGLGVTMKL